MISGTRLGEILAINRAVVQKEMVNISERLLDIDATLNRMRLAEAALWHSYAPSDPQLPLEIEHIEDLIARRQHKARTAAESIGLIEIELASLDKPRQVSTQAVTDARDELDVVESSIKAQLNAYSDPEAQAVNEHAVRLAEWQTEADTVRKAKMATYENDPVFAYLRRRGYGTTNYRGKLLAKLADRWMAQRSGFVEAAANYDALTRYPEELAEWQLACQRAARAVEDRALHARKAAMAPLDEIRANLAAKLNELDWIEGRAIELQADRARATSEMCEVALGQDPEFTVLVNAFLALLTKEKKEAMGRLAANGIPEPDPRTSARIDSLVQERLSISREADNWRRHLFGAERRLNAIDDVASRLSLRQWDKSDAEFWLDERTTIGHDLSTGRFTADQAWQEIAGARNAAPGPKPEPALLSA